MDPIDKRDPLGLFKTIYLRFSTVLITVFRKLKCISSIFLLISSMLYVDLLTFDLGIHENKSENHLVS
jgi:hypothetical protein